MLQDLDNRRQVPFSAWEKNIVPWMWYTSSWIVTPYYPRYPQFALKVLQFIYGKAEVLYEVSEGTLSQRLREIWKDSEIYKVDNLLLRVKGPLQVLV